MLLRGMNDRGHFKLNKSSYKEELYIKVLDNFWKFKAKLYGIFFPKK